MIFIMSEWVNIYFKAQDYSMMAYHYRRTIGNSRKFKLNPSSLYLNLERRLKDWKI